MLFAAGASFADPLPGGTLDPLTIPKYVDPLPIPGVMPKTPNANLSASGIDYYEIAARQFQQQVLSTGLPKTTVWGYGSVNHPGTFHYPSATVEARVDRPVRVKWMNQLVDAQDKFLRPLLPVDQTLHWANPPGDCIEGPKRPDCRGDSQAPYAGPVPLSVHLHGAHVQPNSDGFPEAWFLPAASNIDCIDSPGYPRTRTTADDFFCRGSNFSQIPGVPVHAGAAVFQYRNDQRASTLWFHDHALGMTRTNVYPGLAGFYLLRGGPTDMPSGVPGGLPGGAFEIPLVIHDRSFNKDGSLFYPASRVFFDGYAGPYIGDPKIPSDVAPLHNPEFFGNVMVVNGKTWPFLNVQPRKYRFRLLNASDSRFMILKLGRRGMNFTVIGADGGFLPHPVLQHELLIAPAERLDVIVDFSQLAIGQRVTLHNIGPDEPFGGAPFPAPDADTTGQVMQFRVVSRSASADFGADLSADGAIPPLPAFQPFGPHINVRQVSLNELESSLICVDENNVRVPGTPPCNPPASVPAAPISAQLGTVDRFGNGIPLMWEQPFTENPTLGATEIWEISNFTEDAHPIHVHMVMFQILNRQDSATGAQTGPEPWESGFKDTVIAYPGQVTRIKARFDIAGLFVWHCHILSHEDNEMMRPYCVGHPAGCAP
jgi:FtsP/CotA-like multicopper oxidase with cupredoxin domain